MYLAAFSYILSLAFVGAVILMLRAHKRDIDKQLGKDDKEYVPDRAACGTDR